MTSQPERRSKIGMTYGLIGGIVLIVHTLSLYLFGGAKSFTSASLSLIMYVLITVVAVLAGLAQKKANGGYLDFGTGLKTVFTTFALAFLLQTVFNYVLFNYIDTSFRDEMARLAMEKMEEMLRSFNVPEEKIEQSLQDMASRNNFSIGSVTLGYGMMCIISCIVSLIIAAIIKKNKPPFDNAFKE